MERKPTILITNDDGIGAKGISHLWSALKDFADITIVAPSTEQSGISMGITLMSPLFLERAEWKGETPAWRLSGTPADCVKIALNDILTTPPDLIVSGINRGSNAGRNCLYSGTVGGVIEGVLQGVPGIAFSCVDHDNPRYDVAERHILDIVKYALKNPMPAGTLLNVNIPNQVKGFKMTAQGGSHWSDEFDRRLHPTGKTYYWLDGKVPDSVDHPPDSDTALLAKGYLTAVPIRISDLTDNPTLDEHRNTFEELY
ncbi:MAG: 5'-nucleotidase SurE [Chlamydiae bacterium]|nr:5'-nucleotidase SurE [Chlamydiota bacterium]